MKTYRWRAKSWERAAVADGLDPRRPPIDYLVAYLRRFSIPNDARRASHAIAWYFREEGVPVLVDDPAVAEAIDLLDIAPQDDPLARPVAGLSVRRRRAKRMASAAYSPSTRKGYTLAARLWVEWAKKSGVDPLEPGLPNFKRYVADVVASGLAAQTVANRLHGLSHYFRKGGACDLAVHPQVKAIVDGLCRERPRAQMRSIRLKDVRLMLERMNRRSAFGARNGLLLVCLALGGLALRHVRAMDVSRCRAEEDGIVFTIGMRHMREVKIWECGDPDLSVKTWFRRWSAVIGVEPGPLFPSHTPSGFANQPMSSHAIAVTLRRLAKNAGIPHHGVCVAAIRKGFVVDATRKLGPVAVAAAAGYAGAQSIIDGYGRALQSTRELRLRHLRQRGRSAPAGRGART
ncbi:MAG TPA: hypothetical protein VFO25_08025 [Candidatus Eremiobacteraceae bacterium]|nr:hypothetical protein [Candidatus Eremiobacteraceae bacterium]